MKAVLSKLWAVERSQGSYGQTEGGRQAGSDNNTFLAEGPWVIKSDESPEKLPVYNTIKN